MFKMSISQSFFISLKLLLHVHVWQIHSPLRNYWYKAEWKRAHGQSEATARDSNNFARHSKHTLYLTWLTLGWATSAIFTQPFTQLACWWRLADYDFRNYISRYTLLFVLNWNKNEYFFSKGNDTLSILHLRTRKKIIYDFMRNRLNTCNTRRHSIFNFLYEA